MQLLLLLDSIASLAPTPVSRQVSWSVALSDSHTAATEHILRQLSLLSWGRGAKVNVTRLGRNLLFNNVEIWCNCCANMKDVMPTNTVCSETNQCARIARNIPSVRQKPLSSMEVENPLMEKIKGFKKYLAFGVLIGVGALLGLLIVGLLILEVFSCFNLIMVVMLVVMMVVMMVLMMGKIRNISLSLERRERRWRWREEMSEMWWRLELSEMRREERRRRMILALGAGEVDSPTISPMSTEAIMV